MTVEVRFLGTGNAFADGSRSQACILVTAAEGRILLDCGGSAMPPLRRVCDPTTIDAVAITHLHGDHFGGLPYLAMQQKYAPRRDPLVVAGPPSLRSHFEQASLALFDDFFLSLPYELRFEVFGAKPLRIGPAELVAIPVEHVPESEPHGLRVHVGGKLIAYSGDARWSEALPRIADGADLFICESTYYAKPDPVHLAAREIVEHRAELSCKRLIVTHLGQDALAHLGELGVEHAEEGMALEI